MVVGMDAVVLLLAAKSSTGGKPLCFRIAFL